MSDKDVIRVMLVDDHALIRAGLAMSFEAYPDILVVAEADGVTDALDIWEDAKPDVVVTDLQMPDGTGFDLIRELRAASDEIGLILLTMFSGDDQLFAAMAAGASGFVGKDAPATDVINAVRHASTSPRSFICSGLAEAMMRRGDSASTKLSDREQEVLVLLADGLGTGAIAGKLFMSESTVKTHIAHLYQKLGAANRAQALVAAMRIGLLSSVQRLD